MPRCHYQRCLGTVHAALAEGAAHQGARHRSRVCHHRCHLHFAIRGGLEQGHVCLRVGAPVVFPTGFAAVSRRRAPPRPRCPRRSAAGPHAARRAGHRAGRRGRHADGQRFFRQGPAEHHRLHDLAGALWCPSQAHALHLRHRRPWWALLRPPLHAPGSRGVQGRVHGHHLRGCSHHSGVLVRVYRHGGNGRCAAVAVHLLLDRRLQHRCRHARYQQGRRRCPDRGQVPHRPELRGGLPGRTANTLVGHTGGQVLGDVGGARGGRCGASARGHRFRGQEHRFALAVEEVRR
mmetsp:Transcript_80722/g.212909  ORF Transcript_80722/g.212909 Transcript_80722/m.212909 type:complete len:291 (+) Transcript_80722:287-1159(+)